MKFIFFYIFINSNLKINLQIKIYFRQKVETMVGVNRNMNKVLQRENKPIFVPCSFLQIRKKKLHYPVIILMLVLVIILMLVLVIILMLVLVIILMLDFLFYWFLI